MDLPHPNLVRKLQRSLYGLKHASRQWNTKLTDILLSTSYTQAKAGHSLFTKTSSAGFIVILVYADDFVLGEIDLEEINQLKALLNVRFSIKVLGVSKYFLGFEVARNAQGISLCQRKYVLDVIQDADLLGVKPYNTPMQPHLQLYMTLGTLISDPTAYRRLIGILLYLTHSKSEIVYAVSKLSQFLDTPTDKHMLGGFHVLRFLKNNPGQGLFFSSSSNLCIKGFFYSYWEAFPDARRSTTGICFFLEKSFISWKSKKQTVVSLSSLEVEYRALAHATCEGIRLLSLLDNFNIPHQSPIIIYYDNKYAMHIVVNPVFHERTKYIEIDCHVMRDKVLAGVVHLMYVTSKEKVVDILNKSLHSSPFYNLKSS